MHPQAWDNVSGQATPITSHGKFFYDTNDSTGSSIRGANSSNRPRTLRLNVNGRLFTGLYYGHPHHILVNGQATALLGVIEDWLLRTEAHSDITSLGWSIGVDTNHDLPIRCWGIPG